MSRGIPVIDLQEPTATSQINDAAETFGFFQLINHGIPETAIGKVWSETHDFFSLPREAKLADTRYAVAEGAGVVRQPPALSHPLPLRSHRLDLVYGARKAICQTAIHMEVPQPAVE